jgi:hypothetical protein
MRTFIIPLLLVLSAFFGVSACAEEATEATKSDTFFDVSGDVTVSIDEATATMTKIRGLIPAMTIISTPASVKKLGTSYSVNLFFSNDFEPKPGTYPVEFSYRTLTNTLGGSFMQRGSLFSHDTKGTAEFVEFGERVKVRFEFQTFDKSDGSEGRRGVTVKGEAVCVCPHSDIF